MVQLIDLETAFWITIDITLASLLVYALFRYIKLKRGITKPNPHLEVNRNVLTNKFKEYLLRKGARKAVIAVFNEVVDDLAEANGLSLRRSLTTREVLTILNSKLPVEAQDILLGMYNLYEAARFGDYEPSDIEINQFSKQLEVLDKLSAREYPTRWLDES